MSDKQLIEMLYSNESLDDIFSHIFKKHHVWRKKDAIHFLKRCWSDYNDTRIKKEIESDMKEESDLPGTVVYVDDIKFTIHGVNHGAFNKKMCESSLEFVRNNVQDYTNRGDRVLLERGFAKLLSIDDILEMNPSAYVSDKMGWNLLSMIWAGIYSYFEINSNKKCSVNSTEEKMDMLFMGSVRDKNSLVKYRRCNSIMEIPQPLDMQIMRLTQPFYVYMSEYFVKTSLFYARRLELKNIHIITGLLHESQIVFLLKNPNYLKDHSS